MVVNYTGLHKDNVELERTVIEMVGTFFSESRLYPITLDMNRFTELVDGLGGNKTITQTHIKSILDWLYREGYFTANHQGSGNYTLCVPTSKYIIIKIPAITYSEAALNL